MKTPTREPLLSLINALSKSEKRYFKLYAELHSIGPKNKYVHLFDLLEKSPNIPDKELMLELKLNQYKQLKDQKAYLKEQLIRSARIYRGGKGTESLLSNYLQDISFFYEKGLYKECESTLKKAMTLAEKTESHAFILLYSKWERKLIRKLGYGSLLKSNKTLVKVNKQEQSVTKLLAFEQQLTENIDGLLESLKKGQARNVKEIQSLQKKYPLLHEHLFAGVSSHRIEYLKNYLKVVYFTVGHEFKTAYKYSKIRLGILENCPWIFEDDKLRVLSTYNSHVFLSIQLQKYDEASNALKKIRGLIEKINSKIRISYLGQYYWLSISVAKHRQQYEEGIKIYQLAENWLKTINNDPEIGIYLSTIYFYGALVYFYSGNCKKAIGLLERLLKRSDVMSDIKLLGFVSSLLLVFYYENGDDEHLNEKLVEAKNYVAKSSSPYFLENEFISLVSKLMKCKNKTEKRSVFKAGIARVESEAKSNITLQEPLRDFDFVAWMKSKL